MRPVDGCWIFLALDHLLRRQRWPSWGKPSLRSRRDLRGLVPRQTGSGGKIRLLGISKRGDKYLRTLFIHGARAAALLTKEPGPWITGN